MALSALGHFDPFPQPRLNGRCLFILAYLRRPARQRGRRAITGRSSDEGEPTGRPIVVIRGALVNNLWWPS